MNKVDYGIDAPGVIRNLFLAAVICLIVPNLFPKIIVGQLIIDTSGLRWGTVTCTLGGILMVIYVKYGKFRHRDAMLDMVTWRGDETVLDIGTGRGLLLLGAAKRLTSGKATGIDIWNTEDLTANTKENALANAIAEGVADKIAVESMDARQMTFPDESFDIILSNVCIHNIPDREGRKQACLEIARVLKKGGTALISDFKNIAEYRSFFLDAGLKVISRRGSVITTFPPLTTLIIRK